MSTPLKDPPIEDQRSSRTAGELAASTPHHPWRHFMRHLLEMTAVMVVGMFAAAFVLMVVLNLAIDEITWEQALVYYPVHALLAVAIGMSVPMVPWMRRRGHSRRSAYEMAAVMAVPVIPFVCLALFDVVKGAQCGLYCIIGFLAMPALMFYRLPTR